MPAASDEYVLDRGLHRAAEFDPVLIIRLATLTMEARRIQLEQPTDLPLQLHFLDHLLRLRVILLFRLRLSDR